MIGGHLHDRHTASNAMTLLWYNLNCKSKFCVSHSEVQFTYSLGPARIVVYYQIRYNWRPRLHRGMGRNSLSKTQNGDTNSGGSPIAGSSMRHFDSELCYTCGPVALSGWVGSSVIWFCQSQIVSTPWPQQLQISTFIVSMRHEQE